MLIIKTTTEIIDALGGNQPVAELTSTTDKAVSNWRAFNKFPSNTYLILKDALVRQGKNAPDRLWQMREPSQSQQSRRKA